MAVGTGAALAYSCGTPWKFGSVDAYVRAMDLYYESAVLLAMISLGKYFEAGPCSGLKRRSAL